MALSVGLRVSRCREAGGSSLSNCSNTLGLFCAQKTLKFERRLTMNKQITPEQYLQLCRFRDIFHEIACRIGCFSSMLSPALQESSGWCEDDIFGTFLILRDAEEVAANASSDLNDIIGEINTAKETEETPA